MKKSIFLATTIVVIACCSCNRNSEVVNNSATDAIASIEHDFGYSLDSSVFAAYKGYKPVFQKSQAVVWFVSKWNTPGIFAADTSWDGCAWDGCMFYGFLKGNYVYYPSTYQCYSEEYAKESGQSSIATEMGFPKNGVTTDVRQTCWWISFVMGLVQNDSTDVELDEFIEEATCCQGGSGDVEEFKDYLVDLKIKILEMPGKSNKRKIINYTAQVLSGKPETWDAWEYPGYYKK